MKKRGYEFSFGWIFAIFAGAFIIFLAIYATTRIVQTERATIDTVSAKTIGILLTPVETSLEHARLSSINVPRETRIQNGCDAFGDFGNQKLSALVKSGVGGAWQSEPGVDSTFRNKYIFSKEEVHATKEIYVFTKPFEFPFKIADLTIIWSDRESYCFAFSSNAGRQGEIKNELEALSPKNVFIEDSVGDCSENSRKICFSHSPECDVLVQLASNRIFYENNAEVKFVESTDTNNKYGLLFAAVFSDESIYSCQIKRLALRGDNLADLYKLKSNYLTPKGCSSSPVLPSALQSYQNSLSGGLFNAEQDAEELRRRNANLGCRLF